MVLMRRGVWLARGGRGIAGGEHQIVKAVQDEASPAALRHKAPEAQNFMPLEREGTPWRNLLEAHNAGSARPFDGRAEALKAAGKLTKSA